MYSLKISELPTLFEFSEDLRDRVKHSVGNYISAFQKTDDPVYNQHIELKKFHIKKVCEEITGIGQVLGMNSRQLAFVEVIAWLHDISRFEQFETYRTFSDAESENHAEMSVRIIKKGKILEGVDQQQLHTIFQSILNHNIPKIPDNGPELIDFYSRLLRDADKLDIWRITTETNIFNKIRTESFPTTYIVPVELSECFRKNRIITLDKVNSFYDSILFRLSWIFDINFSFTLKIASERNIFSKLFSKLPSSEELNTIRDLINQYIRWNI